MTREVQTSSAPRFRAAGNGANRASVHADTAAITGSGLHSILSLAALNCTSPYF
jgi:hypothetical protein